VEVSASNEIGSGGCRINLRLGRLSVGVDQQWPVLRNLLGEMAQPEAKS
jgi:flagellar biosynthesis/type III secretory pathway protein FliH